MSSGLPAIGLSFLAQVLWRPRRHRADLAESLGELPASPPSSLTRRGHLVVLADVGAQPVPRTPRVSIVNRGICSCGRSFPSGTPHYDPSCRPAPCVAPGSGQGRSSAVPFGAGKGSSLRLRGESEQGERQVAPGQEGPAIHEGTASQHGTMSVSWISHCFRGLPMAWEDVVEEQHLLLGQPVPYRCPSVFRLTWPRCPPCRQPHRRGCVRFSGLSGDESSMERSDKGREAHIKKMEQETERERDKVEERTGIDREVENELQTVRPGADAPSRGGIKSAGTGADSERG